MVSESLIIAFTLLMGRLVATEASYQWAKRTPSGFRYPVGIGLRILYRGGGPGMIFVGYKVSEQATTLFNWVTICAVVLLGFGCILGEPGEIITTPKGIVQQTYLGLRKRSIPWKGAAARYVAVLREVLVVGKDGTAITHSEYHVGQEQFLRELERYGVFVQGWSAAQNGKSW